MYGIVLVVVLLIMGGAIAYIGDHLGSKIGKKRISIWGLRPKYTSILMTIVTGVLISLLTLGTMTVISNDVRTALFGMEKLNKKIATLNSDIKGKNEEIQQALTQLTEKNDDLKKLDEVIQNNKSKIDELTVAKQSVSQELDKAKETVITAQKQYEVAQKDLATTQAAKDQLLQEINKLSAQIEQLRIGLINMREGQIFLRAGEIVATGELDGGKDQKESIKELGSFINTTNELLVERLGIENKKAQLIFVDHEQAKNTVYKMTQMPGKLYIRMLAEANMVYGEPIFVTLQLLPNKLIYKRGELIYSAQVDLSQQDAQTALVETLRQINSKAITAGIIADPISGTVGNMSIGEMLELTKMLQNQKNKNVTINVKAKKDTYISDSLSVDISVE